MPYLAHPIETVRMMRSADLQRSPYMSKAFPLRAARKPWRFFVPSTLAVVLLAIVVPAVRLVVIVGLAVEAIAVAWYRWRNSSRPAPTTRPAPGRLALPLFTSDLEDGFYRRQWNRYGPIYSTNMLYKPTVAVGGIELGRRILA